MSLVMARITHPLALSSLPCGECCVVPDLVPSEPPAHCNHPLAVVLDHPREVQLAVRISILELDEGGIRRAAQALLRLDLARARSLLLILCYLAVCPVVTVVPRPFVEGLGIRQVHGLSLSLRHATHTNRIEPMNLCQLSDSGCRRL